MSDPKKFPRSGGRPPFDPRQGFTLFEVALSLVLMTFGVVSVLMLIPSGLRQLTDQRFRLYASCIANELIDVYGNADPSSAFCDQEGPGPWDVPIDRRSNAPDLEMRCSNQRFGLLPIPSDIAKRLDSDGEEIAKLIAGGGSVYYVQPNVPNAWREDLIPTQAPNDLQKLVIGVVGSAQHNASYSFPMKRWPYYGTVPGPPLHAIHNRSLGWDPANPTANASLGSMLKLESANAPSAWQQTHATYCWEAYVDPDPALQAVFNAFWDYEMWGNPGWAIPTTLQADETQAPFTGYNYKIRAKLGQYFLSTLQYAVSAGLTQTDLQGFMDALKVNAYPFESLNPDQAAKKILALGYLSNALMCLTRWHHLHGAIGADPDLTTGVDLATVYRIAPPVTLGPITHDRIVTFTRNTRYFTFRFTASHPYNWAVPRPIEHATMMDYPLLELDLFRAPAVGAIWGAGSAGAGAQQWKYLTPTPITSVIGDPGAPFGASLTYPLGRIPAPSLTSASAVVSENGPAPGAVSHSTLLNQFDPSERCRQLVFWVVDWQSYEDCETAPSAAVDASRYLKAAPGGIKPLNAGANGRGWDNAVTPCTSFDDLMWGFTDGWGDATGLEQTTHLPAGDNIQLHRALLGNYLHTYRNPEKNLLFVSSVNTLATGADVSGLKIRDIDRNTNGASQLLLNSPPDYGPPTAVVAAGQPKPPEIFCGQFGADRNGNNQLDRGPLPRSVRLHAVTVARFNYYDMRVSCQIK